MHQLPQSQCVITGRAHCFHDNIYITLILPLWDLGTLCVMDHLWQLISCFLLSLLSTLWFIGTSNMQPYHVPKCISWHKATVVITGRSHCFHDNIYVILILLLWDLRSLFVMDHLWQLILCSLLNLLSTLWFKLV